MGVANNSQRGISKRVNEKIRQLTLSRTSEAQEPDTQGLEQ